jgi:CRP-like cAMP-binding protein
MTMDDQEILEGMQLFAGFFGGQTNAFVRAADRFSAPAGHVFLRMGAANDSIFIVCKGEVRVERPRAEVAVPLATFGPGQAFGEMSFMDGTPATASVVATLPTDVVVLTRQIVDRMIEGHPTLAAKFWRNLALILRERLAKTNEILVEYADIGHVLRHDESFRETYSRT